MDSYGIITLLPPVFIIIFALVTKKTLEALLLGGLIGSVIAYGTGFFWGYLDFMYEVLSDTGNIWMILTVGLFGSFIAIMRKAKATSGFTRLVLKYSDSEKKSMFIAWILGLIIFVDEYLNVLTIGNAMRTVCDQQKTPREMLAYIIDSTGVPVCMLIPISTQMCIRDRDSAGHRSVYDIQHQYGYPGGCLPRRSARTGSWIFVDVYKRQILSWSGS